jgi:S1-C subfamily serine protease
MSNLDLKRLTLYISIGVFWTFGILTGEAQTLSSLGIALDPEVLESHSGSDNNSRLNLDSAIVDIKAVDAPALHSENGKFGVGSEQRFGQGIIIDSAGIIVTNRHIIGNALHILVRLSGGKIYEARILRNSQADLCLIKINSPLPLRAISLADPSEIQIGINVIAIANAGLNFQRKLGGQVIRIFKETPSNNVELLEMNIPLKPGDSGGPVLNVEGSLLGLIMGKKISDPGKSYAIASSKIRQEYYKYRNSILN